MYRGYDIHEMGNKATFEEVAYLLLNGELPNGKQLKEFREQIAAERDLPKEIIEMLRLLPKSTHPMDMLRTGVSMLSAFDKDISDNSHDANIRKSIKLIARVMTLITDGWRISQGEKPLPEKPELSQAGNFSYKLDGRVPEAWQTRMMTRRSCRSAMWPTSSTVGSTGANCTSPTRPRSKTLPVRS